MIPQAAETDADDLIRFGPDHGPRFAGSTYRRTIRTEHDGWLVIVSHDNAPGRLEIGVELDRFGRVVGLQVMAPEEPVTHRPLPAGGLTTAVIRSIPWYEVERAAVYFRKRSLQLELARSTSIGGRLDDDDNFVPATVARLYPDLDQAEIRPRLKAVSSAARRVEAATTRGKRTRRDDRFYARVASRYVELSNDPDQGRHPVKALAEEIGYDIGTVRNWLTEARRRKLLTRTGDGKLHPGKPGGELTLKARQLLAE